MEKNKFVIYLILFVLIIGLISYLFLKRNTPQEIWEGGETKEIQIEAFRFGYTPETITIKRGERVKLVINNTDTLHGIRIPELGIANNNVLEFTAGKSGQFTWFCNNFCGEGHSEMQGTLIVEE